MWNSYFLHCIFLNILNKSWKYKNLLENPKISFEMQQNLAKVLTKGNICYIIIKHEFGDEVRCGYTEALKPLMEGTLMEYVVAKTKALS